MTATEAGSNRISVFPQIPRGDGSLLGLPGRLWDRTVFSARAGGRAAQGMTMILRKADRQELPGIAEMLLELGGGENGFMGNDFAAGTMSLGEYLEKLEDMAEGRNLRPGWVPMTTFWFLDAVGRPVGMSRLRHRLNEFLLNEGGHIGYYIRPSERGKGYGKALLAATLEQARRLGITKALLTVDCWNAASIRVIESNGGAREDVRRDSNGVEYGRYWIELTTDFGVPGPRNP